MKIIAAFTVDPVDTTRADPLDVVHALFDEGSVTTDWAEGDDTGTQESAVQLVHAEWEDGGQSPLELLMTKYDERFPGSSLFARGSANHEYDKTLRALAEAGVLLLPPSSWT